ncbi:MAG: hypothetical protein WCR07_07045 [Verrucomicrobiota bacterium]|jgi:hypothetical protein
MQRLFYQQVEALFSTERLAAYAVAQAGSAPDPCATLARYLLNMALCESLYSPLQIGEIALRNAIHRHLTSLFGREDWHDAPHLHLTPWAAAEVSKAKAKITKTRKSVTSGRVVAELQFGFWTSLFEAHYEQHTPFLPGGIKAVFRHLPKSLHHRKDRKNDLENIRQLRNRVFHHERIVHWQDLDARHERLLEVIGWISPALRQMAEALDRFKAVRAGGLKPWMDKLRRHWPAITAKPAANATIEIVTSLVDATNGAETPFGHRWGGDVIRLTPDHLNAMLAGQILALDVMNEYITFLQLAHDATGLSSAARTP